MATKEEGNKGPEDDFEVRIEDDTPPEDRGRRPLRHDALSVDDEALMQSEKVKSRINELKHAAHDERRRREAMEREHNEAIRLAQTAHTELAVLRRQMAFGQAGFGNERKQKAQLAFDSAKRETESAYEGGDPKAIAEAQARLAMAAAELREADSFAASSKRNAEAALQEQQTPVQSASSHQQQAQKPQPNPRAVKWAEANSSWYGVNRRMTGFVHGVHEELVHDGIHPVHDADTYYRKLDEAVRAQFPNYEWDDESGSDAIDLTGQGKPAAEPKTSSTPRVAPVNRVSNGTGQGKKIVKLTASQAELCKRLGITPQQYASEYLKSYSPEN